MEGLEIGATGEALGDKGGISGDEGAERGLSREVEASKSGGDVGSIAVDGRLLEEVKGKLTGSKKGESEDAFILEGSFNVACSLAGKECSSKIT